MAMPCHRQRGKTFSLHYSDSLLSTKTGQSPLFYQQCGMKKALLFVKVKGK
jgi:hypothetical protein